MFYFLFHAQTGGTAIAQIEHEAGVAGGKAAKFGGGHSGAAQKFFDFADQHCIIPRPSIRGLVSA